MRIHPGAVALASSVLLIASHTAAQEQAYRSGSTEAMLVQMEQEVMDAVVREDKEAFARLLSPDLLYVDEGGVVTWTPTTTDELFTACQTARIALEDIKVIPLTPDLMLVASKATVDQTCGDKKAASLTYITSTWQRRDGKWMAVAHTESSPNY